jgi:hypothetical protein
MERNMGERKMLAAKEHKGRQRDLSTLGWPQKGTKDAKETPPTEVKKLGLLI